MAHSSTAESSRLLLSNPSRPSPPSPLSPVPGSLTGLDFLARVAAPLSRAERKERRLKNTEENQDENEENDGVESSATDAQRVDCPKYTLEAQNHQQRLDNKHADNLTSNDGGKSTSKMTDPTKVSDLLLSQDSMLDAAQPTSLLSAHIGVVDTSPNMFPLPKKVEADPSATREYQSMVPMLPVSGGPIVVVPGPMRRAKSPMKYHSYDSSQKTVSLRCSCVRGHCDSRKCRCFRERRPCVGCDCMGCKNGHN